jgi:sulfite reductase alpha subunit-like flavoprotein
MTAGIVEYKSKSLLDRKGVCTSFLKAQGNQAKNKISIYCPKTEIPLPTVVWPDTMV